MRVWVIGYLQPLIFRRHELLEGNEALELLLPFHLVFQRLPRRIILHYMLVSLPIAASPVQTNKMSQIHMLPEEPIILDKTVESLTSLR